MGKSTLSKHDAIKAAAQYMLKNGFGTYSEIASLSGRSREIIRHWAIQLGAETAHQEHLARLWAKALRESK
jgi:hypothetical protein